MHKHVVGSSKVLIGAEACKHVHRTKTRRLRVSAITVVLSRLGQSKAGALLIRSVGRITSVSEPPIRLQVQ